MYNKRLIVQVFCCIIICLALFHFHYVFNAITSTWFLIGSLLIGGWQLLRQPSQIIALNSSKQSSLFGFVFVNIAAIILLAITYHNLAVIRVAINPNHSDIIPQIQTMAERFLQGEFPYDPIDFGWVLNPTYMPMQWLPYTIADVFQFDPRWISFALLNLGILATNYQLYKRLSLKLSLVIGLLPYAMFAYILYTDAGIIATTVEIGIAGYYMLLVAALLSGKWYWKAIMIGVCLLSRYSLVFWLPLFFFVETLQYGYQQSAKQLAVVVAMVGIFYLPFFVQDTSIFLNGYNYHSRAALGEWERLPFEETGKPIHFEMGIGFANYFWQAFEQDKPTGLALLQKVHAIGSLGITLLLCGVYWFKRDTFNKYRWYAAGGLILYMAIFYGFIQIPYGYLFLLMPFMLYASLPGLVNSKNNK